MVSLNKPSQLGQSLNSKRMMERLSLNIRG
nr:MAG TPA: hypothetical protein [Caudoviricetes sp.]